MLKNSTNAYLSQLSISAWNIFWFGDKIEDNIFREKLNKWHKYIIRNVDRWEQEIYITWI